MSSKELLGERHHQMRATVGPTGERPEGTGLTRPPWLVLSYVLALFTLMTVVTSLFFTHHLVQRYRRTVAVNEEWSHSNWSSMPNWSS